MRKRMIKISVRLNEQEHTHLKRLSETTGLKMEPLVRQLILGRELKPRPPENLAALLRQMSAMGNNINQIARSVNAGIAKPEDVERGLYLLDQVYELMFRIANK